MTTFRLRTEHSYCSNARVVCEHKPAHSVAHGNVGAAFRKSHLNTSGTPRDKCCKLPFSDAEQALVHICRIHLSLDDVQDGDIAALLAGHCRDHPILGLEKSSHDIQDGRLADGLGLLDLIASEWCIRGHEEVAAWSRN